MTARPLLRRLFTLHHHSTGMAAVEFAMAAPFLILLFLGTFQLMDAVGTKRKIVIATRAIADLTTQYTSISSSEATSLLSSATQIMMPYDASPGTYTVSQIYVDAAGKATISWSKARNGTARAAGSTVTVPSGIAQKDSYVILAESTYPYTPPLGKGLLPSITLTDAIYMYPRRSNSVDIQ